jgi:ribosomal protein S18 acetylase RimI-like enzyme
MSLYEYKRVTGLCRVIEMEKVTPAIASCLNHLVQYLRYQPDTKEYEERLKDMAHRSYIRILLAFPDRQDWRDEQLMGAVVVYTLPTLSGIHGHVEDLVVGLEHRHKGIGQALMQAVIDLARNKGWDHVEMTCNPKRVEALALYEKLGFVRRKTNVLRKEMT